MHLWRVKKLKPEPYYRISSFCHLRQLCSIWVYSNFSKSHSQFPATQQILGHTSTVEKVPGSCVNVSEETSHQFPLSAASSWNALLNGLNSISKGIIQGLFLLFFFMLESF